MSSLYTSLSFFTSPFTSPFTSSSFSSSISTAIPASFQQWLLGLLGPDTNPEAWAPLSFGLVLGFIAGCLLTLLAVALISRVRRKIETRAEEKVGAQFESQLHSHLQDAFHAISSEALDRSSERFLALAGERLGALNQSNADALLRREEAVKALVRPIHESLSRVDEKLQHVETERAGQYASLAKHLELVATANRALEKQTQSLSQALRSPNVRGRWGELQLRRVVELAGMLEHCDFFEQVTSRQESGAASRPDMVVRLPGGRSIAIDAKAPLDAYLAASEAGDDIARKGHLVEHARHVRRHVDALSSRAYWSQLEGSPDFVVLFLPGEPFFADAIATDPELIERGVAKKVLLAGPTTLIALLRAISFGWQQESMAQNAASISELGRELYERLMTLNEHFETLGKRLDGAVEAYNSAMGSLETRVHVSARKMGEMGIAGSETLPKPSILEQQARLPRENADKTRQPNDSQNENGGEAAGDSQSHIKNETFSIPP